MHGFFMFRWGVFVPIDFDEDKMGRVVLLLDNIKAKDTFFLHAFFRVLDAGLLEGTDIRGLGLGLDMNDKHRFSSLIPARPSGNA